MESKKKSYLSSIYTDAELAVMNFNDEQKENLEFALQFSEAIDMMPDPKSKEYNEMCKKIKDVFMGSNDVEANARKYLDLPNTDPKLMAQIVTLSTILDAVEEVPPAKTEKVSTQEIVAEQNSVSEEIAEQRKQAILDFLNRMPNDYDPQK